jgi:hypothetical protein
MSVLEAEFAWPGGDRPGPPDFEHEPPPAVASAVTRALASAFPAATEPDARLHTLRPPTGPVGRYRLATARGAWFVRVSTRWGNPELERALTTELAARGVCVNPLLVAGRPLQWNDDVLRVDVRPMITGRHFGGAPAELQRLAATLGACHHALVDSPRATAVRAVASARYERLAKIRDLVVDAVKREAFEVFGEQAAWARRHRDWLGTMADRFEPRLDERAEAQCLHGEVHPGNVLFRADDGAAVLVDFEESVHVFAPPAWDVAFLVQRFCLFDDPAPARARERLALVSRAYGPRVVDLAGMMRQAAWFSIAAILDMRLSQGIATPVAEYDKFVRLERQARAFEGVL